MKTVHVVLNTSAAEYSAIQRDLADEMDALSGSGVTVTTKKAPPPEGTLAIPEAYQFIVEHSEQIPAAIALGRALIDMVRAVLNRRAKATAPSGEPLIVIQADNAKLELPGPESRDTKFLRALAGAPPKASATKAKAKARKGKATAKKPAKRPSTRQKTAARRSGPRSTR